MLEFVRPHLEFHAGHSTEVVVVRHSGQAMEFENDKSEEDAGATTR